MRAGPAKLAGLGVFATLVMAACAQLAGVEDGKLAPHGTGGSAASGGVTSGGGTNSGGAGGNGTGASGGTGGASGGTGGASGGTGGASGGTGGASGGAGGTGGVTASTKYAKAVLADGPLAFWRLGDAVGSAKAVDATGNGNDGTVVGPVKFGEPGGVITDSDTAAFFDGTTYIDAGDKFGFVGTAKFTLEAWVYPEAPNRGFLGKTYDNGSTIGYMLAEGGGVMQFIREAAVVAVPQFSETAFTYLVATYDGVNMVVYINGAKVKGSVYANSVSSHPTHFMIGKAVDWSSMVGWIDEVAVYDKPLTDTQVAAHYTAATTP